MLDGFRCNANHGFVLYMLPSKIDNSLIPSMVPLPYSPIKLFTFMFGAKRLRAPVILAGSVPTTGFAISSTL